MRTPSAIQQGKLVDIYRSWPTYEEVLKRLNKSSENQYYTSKNPDKALINHPKKLAI